MKIAKKIHSLSVFIFILSGCASVRHAIPPDLLSDARVYGMQDIRAFSGSPSDYFKKDLIKLFAQEEKGNPSFFSPKTDQTYAVLAISGGAGNGAYGAGLLNGWSESGTRPVFKVVTGISTGAIIAPIAFLGSKYDGQLKEFYTKYSTKHIARIRIPFSNSFANTRPLERLIERYFDASLLKEIAAEYNKGRRLYVGTTNLDAQRLVVWDMGKIASLGDDKALKLFQKIILASASMPIAFPPVYLKVEVNDKTYDEMHVDGGVTRQVFFLYDVLRGFDKAFKEKGRDASGTKYTIYVIRNGYVDPLYREVHDKLVAIADRAVDTMINAQSIGDLYQLYVFAKDGGRGDFNLAYIPATHVSKAKELFDPVEMQALFDLGFKEALQGYPWRKSPPGIGEI
ncbi:MAG: patatin-like phospholipase family protein [Candidatus Omnitrophota bacterium]